MYWLYNRGKYDVDKIMSKQGLHRGLLEQENEKVIFVGGKETHSLTDMRDRNGIRECLCKENNKKNGDIEDDNYGW